MKVTKYIEIPGIEVDVEVSVEDISSAILEAAGEEGGRRPELCIANAVSKALMAVSDEGLKGLSDKQRALVGAFLREQATRWLGQAVADVVSPQQQIESLRKALENYIAEDECVHGEGGVPHADCHCCWCEGKRAYLKTGEPADGQEVAMRRLLAEAEAEAARRKGGLL